jgi:hypothetical protein
MSRQFGVSGAPRAPYTLPISGGGAPPEGGTGIALAGPWHQRRLQALDLAAFFGAVAVLGSLFMPWYQFAFRVDGLSYPIYITALSSQHGGWRWLMTVFSLGIAAELLATLFIFKARTRIDWPHRSLLTLLSGANLVLVVGAVLAAPFGVVGHLGPLSPSLAAGAYVGLVGAAVGLGAAICRLFTGPPALVR